MSALTISPKQQSLAQSFISKAPEPSFTASEGEQNIEVPSELNRLLGSVLRAVAEGGSVTLQTLPNELSTTVAADEIGVSRPTIMRMIKDGEIPAHKVGSHHRLMLADVKDFRRVRLERQRQAFEELRLLEDELE